MLLSGRRAALVFAIASFSSLANAQGTTLEKPVAGDDSITIQIGLFDMDDSGAGNPFLDETLTVIEPIVIYNRQITDTFGLTAELSYDYVSSASIDRLSNFSEQSGASGDNYIGADIGFRHVLSEGVSASWHLGGSNEYDYSSIGLGGSVTVASDTGNASTTFSLETFFDSVDVIRFDGTGDGSDSRTSLAATVSRYGILTPTVNGELGLTVSNQSGFLETPYNAVVLEDPALAPNPNLENNARGIETTEELPDGRTRFALFGRARKYLGPGRAVELGGRLYQDTWGIGSVTVEPRYYRSLSEQLMLRLRYRYYNQTAADDYGEEFLLADPLPDERTQDSDLGDFDSHTLGFRFDWARGPSSSWGFSYDYVMRSDDLDHMFAAISWTRGF